MERKQVERLTGIRFIGQQPTEERLDQAAMSLKSAMKIAGFGSLSESDLTGRSFIFLSEEGGCVLTGVVSGMSVGWADRLTLTISCQSIGPYRVKGLEYMDSEQRWCLRVWETEFPILSGQIFGYLAIVTVPTELDKLPPLPE